MLVIFAYLLLTWLNMNKFKRSHNTFKDHFKDWNRFTKRDMYDFYLAQGKKLSDAAIRWRIHDLKHAGILHSVETGVYAISDSSVFVPNADKFMKKAVKLFRKKYGSLHYCMWNTRLLNSFSVHQAFKNFYVFDADRDITESVFYYFKESSLNVFRNPDMQTMDDYVIGGNNVIVLRPMVSRSPVIVDGGITFPALEKILVDIFCDQHQFYAFGGHEMEIIFENAFQLFNINLSSLFAYASRRGKKKKIREFINEHVLYETIEK